MAWPPLNPTPPQSDPAKPEASKIAFTVDVASATLGVPETDAELPKATWFNTSKFPQVTFQSTAVKGLGGGKFEVVGGEPVQQ